MSSTLTKPPAAAKESPGSPAKDEGKGLKAVKAQLYKVLNVGRTKTDKNAAVIAQKNKVEVKDRGFIKPYEDALAAAEQAAQALSTMLGEPALEGHRRITSAITKATGEAVAGTYRAAIATLEAAAIAGLVKAAEKGHEAAIVQASTQFKATFEKAKALRELAAGATVLNEAESAEYDACAATAMKPLVGKMVAFKKDSDPIDAELDAAATRLRGRIIVCGKAKAGAEAQMAELAKFAKSQRATLPVDFMTGFDYRLTQARSQIDGRDYEAAATTTAQILAETDVYKKAEAASYDKLAGLLGVPVGSDGTAVVRKRNAAPAGMGTTGGIDALLKQAQALSRLVATVPPLETPPAAAETVGRLMRLRELVEAGTIGETISAGETVAQIEACKGEIELNKGRVASFQDPAFIKARADVQTAVDAETRMNGAALNTFRKLAQPLTPAGVDTGALTTVFEARLQAGLATWARQMKAATTVFDLTTPVDCVVLLKTLRDEVRALYKGSEQECVTNVVDLAAQSQKRDMDAALAACSGKVDELAALDTVAGKIAYATLQAIAAEGAKAKDVGAFAKCLADVGALSSGVASSIAACGTSAATLQAAIATQVAAAGVALQAVDAKMIKEQVQADYLGLCGQFADTLAVQGVLARSGDPTVLQKVASELSTLMAGISTVSGAIDGKKGAGDAIYTNADARKKIIKGGKKLADKTLTEFLSVRRQELQAELDGFLEELSGSLPEETNLKLNAWDAKLATAKADAENAKQAHITVTAKSARIAEALAGPKYAAKGNKPYCDALRAKLSACCDAFKASGDAQAAEDGLATIDAEIKAASDPDTMKAGVTGVLEAAQQEALDRAEWSSRLKAFETRIAGETSWLSKQRKELEGLAKQADKTFEKSGDLRAAMQQLQSAVVRADYYTKYPEGQDIAVREKLPKVVAAYGSAVEAMRKALEEVKSAVAGLPATDLAEGDRVSVADMIDALRGEFTAAVLIPVAKQMNEKGRDKTKMRAVRETGLREVSRMLAVLETDVRCEVMRNKNPFSRSASASFIEARLALLKVEYMLQTSL